MEKLKRKNKVEGVVVGVVISCSDAGVPMVAFPGNISDAAIEAKSTIPIGADSIGHEVALLFEGGDVGKPLIIGLMHKPLEARSFEPETDKSEASGLCKPSESTTDLIVDGESVKIAARQEIILKCGKASITLTSSGKVIVRGNYISTRSSGVNRIKGGSVQIN